ncbi:Pantothenate kinase 4 [Trichostrongylus colubriformis]|uniref:4'-phosphopantetheine phosphatase n=1 Tax=Trichostrongylus colubriformis TaxID=6319 RepID=A0AAN8IAQ8_TRICO
MASSSDSPQSIKTVLKNPKSIKRIAFDIGKFNFHLLIDLSLLVESYRSCQSVVKIAYTATVARKKTTHDKKLINDAKFALRLYCIQVRLEDFEDVLDYIAEQFFSLHKVEEMDCLVRGTNFLIRNIEAESFTYDHHHEQCRYHFETIRPSVICPYLLVNVGTGVSVFRVDSDDKYERVGGSSLGGGCFFGLGNLLTAEVDLDEMMRMAEDGDHRQFDILVSDIYGGKFTSLGLSGDLIAGSFGKCAQKSSADELKKLPEFKKNVMRSLLLMISNSIGQGTQQAHFLRHEGYTSAIGAYLNGASLVDPNDAEYGAGYEAERLSWHEYYSGCSELGRFVPTAPLTMGFTAGVLELECAEIILRPFPLLAENLQVYKPDVADLNLDSEAREFWLHTFEKSVDNVMKKAVESQENSETAVQRVQVFREKFLKQLMIIREKPFAYGNSNVRNLLDLREQLLNEQNFDDSYLNQKTMENAAAMKELPSLLKMIDEVDDKDERLHRVALGLLAGNVFDWGAQKGLSFADAVSSIPERPWLIDTYDEFKSSLNSKPYNCAAIFVDNSGADFILGVIPFARELLKRGSRVIIISNLSPALNDLTYPEMMEMVPLLRDVDRTLKEAIDDGRLMFEHSGQNSPCLDLRRMHSVLNSRVLEERVDLVVIEGMGRALHTNLHAQFVCDSLKAAVIKTQWLGDRMGGKIFSVVFKFERGKGNGYSSSTTKSVNLAV